ncbi:neuronal acetylcholine receptor subunit alpha-7-like [Hydractinia symbiolongicarpus]|uniref:neuronal acetylcholine receptor subunit alpha-7-like n=1 Tax=Hydractinia symbiolongicarpus TaxID=13093 RepID=UPI00254E276D|nr:neuronal acetylcholine receptor subunit alpha-7-like [Hydractinia symbiolongicarpus]XP_057306715.1 neuronal acetylcholine receptor subunit alpha-7-like [Hydractinia symbiolongicarpus]XP_057306723.1 neuronal acetylcholine receptor subunit alpha-7-like [Hydractinia symbiolongicarpus]
MERAILLLTLLHLSGIKTSIVEDRLLADLFQNYNPAARPALNDTDTVNVTFGLTLSQIIDVHEKNQFLVISAFIRQKWKNPILKWVPTEYNNITEINIDPKKIWRPDIILYNNADEDKTFGGNLDRLNTRAILKYTGDTQWLAPIILKSKCDIDVKYFPFDTQRCPLKFGSWTYAKDRLDFFSEGDSADIKSYSKNSEWLLRSAKANRSEEKYICCEELFSDVTYTIEISRRSLFYLLNLIFPMTIIGMLTMLSFLLPAESGERISLAITLLLAMTVFMLVVADIIPATSDVIPLVGMFFSASMVEMVLMIVVLCYVMRLHHKDSDRPPMSAWMRRYVLDWLSYKVGIRVRKDGDNALCNSNHNYQLNSPLLLNNQAINSAVLNKIKRQNMAELDWKQNKTASSRFNNHNENTFNRNSYQRKVTGAELVISKLDVLIEKIRSMEEQDLVKTEWRIVAMTIDRCLLVFFAFVFLTTFFGCFLTAPGYVP